MLIAASCYHSFLMIDELFLPPLTIYGFLVGNLLLEYIEDKGILLVLADKILRKENRHFIVVYLDIGWNNVVKKCRIGSVINLPQ